MFVTLSNVSITITHLYNWAPAYPPPPFPLRIIHSQDTQGTSCLVDGGKRDTLVWPGDMFVSGPSVAYSTYNMDAIKNSIESLLALQTAEGLLPYVGIPFNVVIDQVSYTYHLHTLVGMHNYYIYTGDKAWLSQHWDRFKLGLSWSLSQVDGTGLYNLTSSADWCRSSIGGHNIEANAILYYVLNLGTQLAGVVGDSAAADNYTAAAAILKEAANKVLWREDLGVYTDNENTDLAPQDGNSFAGQFAARITSSFSSRDSAALRNLECSMLKY